MDTEDDKKEIKIGTLIGKDIKESLIKLLDKYKDVFTWSYQDMSGLDINVIVHKLLLKPECKLVKQKLWRMRPNMSLKIREKVKK